MLTNIQTKLRIPSMLPDIIGYTMEAEAVKHLIDVGLVDNSCRELYPEMSGCSIILNFLSSKGILHFPKTSWDALIFQDNYIGYKCFIYVTITTYR